MATSNGGQSGQIPLLPGVEISGITPVDAPTIVVPASHKFGKSCLVPTLFNWPGPGGMPLVLAWDHSGPDACAGMGYPVAHIKMKNQPGVNLFEKGNHVLDMIESNKRADRFPYTSIIVDCASTYGYALFDEAKQAFPNMKDERKYYGIILPQMRVFFRRVIDLGLPNIWLSWLRESSQTSMGGIDLPGSFKNQLGGIAHMILILELRRIGQGQPGADEDGNIRLLHTRPWMNCIAGGRYRLPEPCPPHLGYILDLILGRTENPARLLPAVSTVAAVATAAAPAAAPATVPASTSFFART